MLSEQKPVWEKGEERAEARREDCAQGQHVWVAQFWQSGRLAYWECAGCGLRDGANEELPAGMPKWPAERMDWVSGWIEERIRLVAQGAAPPRSRRRWETPDGAILVEEEPSSILFLGLEIPELGECHAYRKIDRDGVEIEAYQPAREKFEPARDHYWLTRYQVVGSELVKYVSHCFEDSTYEVPNAKKPDCSIVYSDLKRLPG